MTGVSAATSNTELVPPRCANCNAPATGRFCSECGARAMAQSDLSLGHYLREATAAITDLDSALIRSMVTLVTRPGRLTAAYLAGERHRYLAPFKVFLFCNVLYFVAVATMHVSVLTTSYHGQLDQMFYDRITRSVIEHRYGIRHVSTTETESGGVSVQRDPRESALEARFNGATEGVGKASLAVLIPLFALLLTILYIGSGRYVAEHFVFATHLTGALLIAIPLLGLVMLVVETLIYRIFHVLPTQSEAPYVVSLLLPFAVYASMAQRVVYRGGWLATLARTALLIGSVAFVIPAFKLVLFFITLVWIGR